MEKARNTEEGYLRHVGNGRVYPLKFFQKCPFKFLFLLLMDSLKDPACGAASPHCFIAFPGYSLRSWEPLFLITCLNRSSALYSWQDIMLCCAIPTLALARIPLMGFSNFCLLHHLWLRHSSIVFGAAVLNL